MVTCRVCGTLFRAPAITVQRYTCSRRCKAIWQMRHQQRRDTDIERAIEAALDRRGWVYEKQVRFGPYQERVSVDFLLPELNVALFCDGDFFHDPNRFPEIVERDAWQEAKLQALGFAIIRLSGKAIHTDPDTCLDEIIGS